MMSDIKLSISDISTFVLAQATIDRHPSACRDQRTFLDDALSGSSFSAVAC